MLILVPYMDLGQSADSFLLADLKSQICDVRQFINILETVDNRSNTHCGTLTHISNKFIPLWENKLHFLKFYFNVLLLRDSESIYQPYNISFPGMPPYWLGYPALHDSHKSYLIKHNASYKAQFPNQRSYSNLVFPTRAAVKLWKFPKTKESKSHG